jgi:drug/metabolite transporter (DMT)-like permease
VALLAVTATWGSTFFLIRDLVRTIPPTDFLAVRFAIATVFMVALFWRQLTALTRRQWVTGAGLGGLYGAAQIGQTIGLAHTSASLSGFITGMYVVLTPVFASVLLRDRVNRATWVAVALSHAVVGGGLCAAHHWSGAVQHRRVRRRVGGRADRHHHRDLWAQRGAGRGGDAR